MISWKFDWLFNNLSIDKLSQLCDQTLFYYSRFAVTQSTVRSEWNTDVIFGI